MGNNDKKALISRASVQEAHEFHYEYMFYCPGCRCSHWFKTQGAGPKWTFNGDLYEKPTVNPSIRVKYHTEKKGDVICHFFIKEGKIAYCEDSTHSLAGKTIDMVPYDE